MFVGNISVIVSSLQSSQQQDVVWCHGTMVARSHCGPRVSVLVSSWLVSQALSSLTTTVVQLHCKTYWLTTTSNKNHHLNTLTHIKTILYCALHITVCLYRMSFNAYYYRNYFIMNHFSLSLSLSALHPHLHLQLLVCLCQDVQVISLWLLLLHRKIFSVFTAWLDRCSFFTAR